MSYIILPDDAVLRNLPARSRSHIFFGAHVIHNHAELDSAVHELRSVATQITNNIKAAFNAEQLKDFDKRPVIAVLADGATIHTSVRDESQRALQQTDSKGAFELGRALANNGWRVALAGYNGLCEAVLEGVQSVGGHYIVTTTKRSLNYDENRTPILPENGSHGFYIVTNTLAESKSVLFALSDSGVYFRGGFNTHDVLTDHFTMQQTSMFQDYRLNGDHNRRLILQNDDGFWDSFVSTIDHMVRDGFVDGKMVRGAFVDNKKIELFKLSKSLEDTVKQLEERLPRGASWPEPVKLPSWLFIPSQAITLAAELSRASVMRQIKPSGPDEMLTNLDAARGSPGSETDIDPAIREAIMRPAAAVYCGSRTGHNPHHVKTAGEVGALLREMGYTLIYGGSTKGVMGAVADGYLDNENTPHSPCVLAITPFPFLLGNSTAANEGFHPRLTATIAVPDMHARKMLMTSLTSGSAKSGGRPDITVALSGGVGTLDEVIEEIELNRKGQTDKLFVFVSVNGYWDKFDDLFKEPIRRGYAEAKDFSRIKFVKSPAELRAILLAESQRKAKPALTPA